jgi:hypothetical protein
MILYRVVDNLDQTKLSSNCKSDIDDITFALADYLIKLKYNLLLLLKSGSKYTVNRLINITNHISIIILKSNNTTEPIYIDRLYYNLASKKFTYNDDGTESPNMYPDVNYIVKDIDKLVIDLQNNINHDKTVIEPDNKDKPVNKISPKLPDIIEREKEVDIKTKIKQEKEDEKKNIFKVDKQVYFTLKAEGIDGSDEDKIPILFVDKYPVFKFLDTNNLLDQEQEYELFTDLYNKLLEKDNNIQDKLNEDQVHEIFF